MSLITPFLPALKGFAIAGSFTNAGTMTSGFRLLPAIYPQIPKSPQDAAKQFEYFYWNMSSTVPIIDLTTFIAIGAIAWAEYYESGTITGSTFTANAVGGGLSAGVGERPWKIWAVAGALMPVGWAWVRRVMNDPSIELLGIAGSDANGKPNPSGPVKASGDRTLAVMQKFNSQMSFRMSIPWIVGALALWASLGY